MTKLLVIILLYKPALLSYVNLSQKTKDIGGWSQGIFTSILVSTPMAYCATLVRKPTIKRKEYQDEQINNQ